MEETLDIARWWLHGGNQSVTLIIYGGSWIRASAFSKNFFRLVVMEAVGVQARLAVRRPPDSP